MSSAFTASNSGEGYRTGNSWFCRRNSAIVPHNTRKFHGGVSFLEAEVNRLYNYKRATTWVEAALALSSANSWPICWKRRWQMRTGGTGRMTFAQRTFRDALGLFPTGVAVVTTITRDGTRLGTTVSSFNSVSLSPPLVLFSIARSTNSFPFWGEAETYTINILHEHQEALSTRFARALTEKWEGIKPLAGQTGSLLVPGALASFECENYARYDGGDHLILVGRVRALTTTNVSDPRPLIFYRGSYQRIERSQASMPQDLDYLLHGW